MSGQIKCLSLLWRLWVLSHFSYVWLLATPWTVAHQAPLSMGFSTQEYWSGLPFPSPGDLPNPGIKPPTPAFTNGFFTTEPPGKPWIMVIINNYHLNYSNKVKVKSLSHVQLFVTPWTVAYQAPLSMGFSTQEYWSGVPLPSPVDLPDPGIEPGSPTL